MSKLLSPGSGRHLASAIVACFEKTRIFRAGPVPVMALAQRARLTELVASWSGPAARAGVNTRLKVPCLGAGMTGRADSLRHGGHGRAVRRIRAPSTLGSHLPLLYLGKCPPARGGEPAAARRIRARRIIQPGLAARGRPDPLLGVPCRGLIFRGVRKRTFVRRLGGRPSHWRFRVSQPV